MKKSSKTTKRVQQATSKCPVDCTDCLHSHLVQYEAPRDPLLAECHKKPQHFNARFPFQVEVARAKRLCSMHEHTDEVKTIEKRIKPMFVGVGTSNQQQKVQSTAV